MIRIFIGYDPREAVAFHVLSHSIQARASLPVTIFKFAMSPYENWQKLAWAGVFLITVGVLMLNILARVLFKNKH